MRRRLCRRTTEPRRTRQADKEKNTLFHQDRGYFSLPFTITDRSSILLDIQDVLAVIETAYLADVMGLYHLIALRIGALYQTGCNQLGVIGASGISASLGNFTLWYCHDLNTPFFFPFRSVRDT